MQEAAIGRQNPKLLFVGLDAGDPVLLDRWAASGDLPFFADLRRKSISGVTASPLGFGDGVFWPSFFTGLNPGRHGRYFARQLVPGTYRTAPFSDDTDYKAPPVWRSLSDSGYRSAIIDMVHGPLDPSIDGVTVCDWQTHDRGAPLRTIPAELIDDILERYGDDPFDGSSERGDRTVSDWKKFSRQTVERIRTKTRFASELLAGSQWDFFAVVYADPHDLCHQAWHFHDPQHAEYDEKLVSAIGGDPVKGMYLALDAAIGELVRAVGDSTIIMLVAGPGMEAGYSANQLLDQILRRLEAGPESDSQTFVDRLKTLGRRILPAQTRILISSRFESASQHLLENDRRARRCFAVPHNENSGAIRINLIGRDPDGKVKPGEEYETLCRSLEQDLMEIVEEKTGAPIVKQVVHVRETCHGDQMDALPDLLVIWNRPHPIEAIVSPKIGSLRRPKAGVRTGDHTSDGCFLFSGNGLSPVAVEAPVSVMDLGATIPALFQVPPQNLDGTPIKEVLKASASPAA